MYELSVTREFCAAHAIVMAGEQEAVHGHNWKTVVVVQGQDLDEDGLLCDFHLLERAVDEVLSPLHNADLNATPPFDEVNPTAERVAEHIGRSLVFKLAETTSLAGRVEIASVSVTEAPGCQATWKPN